MTNSNPTAALSAISPLSCALSLAAAGYPVFPCRSDDKRPCIPKSEGGNGFKDASKDQATIRAWWAQYPDALVGVPTGTTTGLFVVDDDTAAKPDAASSAWLATLPSTRIHSTRSGGKHHLYAQPTGTVTKSKAGNIVVNGVKLASVDTRGDGGYIIWWPFHGGTSEGTIYTPLPQSLVAQLAQGPAPDRIAQPSPETWKPGEMRRALAFVPPPAKPGYGDWIEMGQALHHESGGSEDGLALWDEWSAGKLTETKEQPGNYQDIDDCRKHWSSFKSRADRASVTAGTLYLKAKENGYKPSVDVAGKFGGPLPPFASTMPVPAGTLLVNVPTPPVALSPSERFPIYTFDEMLARPPLQWTVKGVMPSEGVAAIYGPAGSGKSFLLFDMLAAVARGADWFGRRVKKSPVLYVALEGAAGFRQRAAAYAKKFGTKPEMLFITAPLDICDPNDVAALIEAIRAKGWQGNGVIALDTLNAAMPGRDENGPQDMGAAIAGLKAVQRAFGGLAIIVHHTGKNVTAGLRGHSSLHGALDAAIEVVREGLAAVRTWNMAKLKDGGDGDGPTFTLESVYLGNDEEDGEPITSCVISRPASGADSAAIPLKPQGRLGKNQSLALDIINKLLAEPSALTGLPATVPKLQPAVAWEVAKVAVGKDYQLEEKRKGPEAHRVIQSLIDNGRLATDGEYLWATLSSGPLAARAEPQ